MISIVTPTLNPGVVLEGNLRSLALQKADFEHIVQDGGSRDGTAERVSRYTAQYPVQFHQDNDSGIYDGVVRGMVNARGDILAWLGADDFYLPWTLSTVHQVFARHPEVDWIIGIPTSGYNQNQVVKVSALAPVYLRSLIHRGWHCSGYLGNLQQESMFWRRSLWEKSNAPSILGGYKLAGDYHLWKEFARHAPLWTVSSVLAVFSISANQSSRRHLSKYNEEIGPFARGLKAARWGKALRGIVSVLGNHRVLRPEAGLTEGSS